VVSNIYLIYIKMTIICLLISIYIIFINLNIIYYIAVNYLHENNISHADLKLENVLIDKDRNIKLTDFNLAYEFIPGEQNKLRCGSLE